MNVAAADAAQAGLPAIGLRLVHTGLGARVLGGDGSYVGSEPPEGFVIKGNERSMKYHVQGNGGYERTIADVWFSSEDAAEAAGFTRAKR